MANRIILSPQDVTRLSLLARRGETASSGVVYDHLLEPLGVNARIVAAVLAGKKPAGNVSAELYEEARKIASELQQWAASLQALTAESSPKRRLRARM